MMSKNYYNKDMKPLYVLHFPGTGLEGHQFIINDNLSRKIKISKDLSIISIMNKSCWENDSYLRIQLEVNDIPLYNTAIDEYEWNNTLKIKHILKSLELIDTKYCLILDGRDVVICNDLDNEFIEKYKSFSKPIVYNGTPAAYPSYPPVETLQEVMMIKGKQKYLNAGVCIGDKETLVDFYTKAQEINEKYPDNHSEQLIIRMTRKQYPDLAGHDSNNDIFRIVHSYDTSIEEVENGYILI